MARSGVNLYQGQPADIYIARNQRGPKSDYLHFVGQSGEPPFQNGWLSQMGLEVGFFKDETGDVSLVGELEAPNTNAPAAVVFTLPEGYRPETREYHLCKCFDFSISGASQVLMQIRPNGDVYFPGGPKNSIGLDNLRWFGFA